MAHSRGQRPVVAALIGNFLVTLIKAFAALTSGSSAMFSEAVHSLGDTLNQLLLFIGVSRSRMKASEEFEYGYGFERFFWALISACGIFFVGAGINVYRGILALTNPTHLVLDATPFIVLLASFAIEFWTFRVAARELRTENIGLPWIERLNFADPTALAVYLEDGVAVIGVVIAALALGLTYATGNPVWDACGSIAIGVLLAIAAVILIVKNRQFLIGRSIPESERRAILELLATEPAIERVIDFKSTVLGIGVYRIKCEIEFNGSALLEGPHQMHELKNDFEKIKNDYEEFKKFYVDYADRVPRLIGKRIDAIEAQIREKFPKVHHIDIEIN